MTHDRAHAKLTTIATFPEHYFLENIAVRSDGSMLVTALNRKELWYVPLPSENATLGPVMVGTLDNVPLGIVENEPDVFYVNTLSVATLERFDLRGWAPGAPANRTRVLTSGEPTAGLNGNCLVAPNVILIADCAAGLIWRVDVSEDGQAATAVEWLKHQSMAPGRDPSMAVKLTPTVSIPYPGINGIRYARKTHFVYYTSSSHSLFMRVAVDPVTHKPAGEPEVVAEDLHGVDDFCIDEKANVAYTATHVKNTILRVPLDPATLDSPRRAVVVEPISGQLSGPSSLAWGRGSVDYGRVAFASTDGGHTAHTGPVRPAAVVRVEFEEGSGVQHR